MKKKFFILSIFLVAAISLLIFMKYNSFSTGFIWRLSNEGKLLFPLVSISALIDSINPCAFSILLLTIAFLFSLGALRGNIIRIGIAYISGIFIAYLSIGLGMLSVLH